MHRDTKTQHLKYKEFLQDRLISEVGDLTQGDNIKILLNDTQRYEITLPYVNNGFKLVIKSHGGIHEPTKLDRLLEQKRLIEEEIAKEGG